MYHIKNDKRSIQSSKWIYAALTTLMYSADYKNIKVTEIVKKAKLGRATFYRNFDSKDDVLQYICDKTFKELLDYLMEYGKKNSIQHDYAFLEPFLCFFDKHTLIVKQLILANRQDMLSKSLANILKAFKPQYDKAVDEPDKTWDYFVAIRCGITINILIQWVSKGKNLPPDELSNLLLQQKLKKITPNQYLNL